MRSQLKANRAEVKEMDLNRSVVWLALHAGAVTTVILGTGMTPHLVDRSVAPRGSNVCVTPPRRVKAAAVGLARCRA